MNIKVSVIVPVYNTEKYLAKCLDSIINQTLEEIEIIVINDGSTDNSMDIIKSFALKDNRIVVLDIENGGVSKARNIGIDVAKGKYMIFIDSDDFISLDMLEHMYKSITDNNCDMCVCNMVRVFGENIEQPFFKMPENKIIIPLDNNAEFINNFLCEIPYSGQIGQGVSNKLFKTDFIRETKVVFEERKEIFAEDALFVFSVLPKVKKFSVINKPFYYYYQRESSVMNTYRPNLLERWKNLIAKMQSRLIAESIYEFVKKGLSMKCFIFFIEILYNEIEGGKGYKKFIDICKDRWMRNKIMEISDTYKLSKNRRLIYFLYFYKLYSLLYIIFMFRVKRNKYYKA